MSLLGVQANRAVDALGTRTIRLEENTILYAIGDVHGRLDLLRRIDGLIAEDMQAFVDPVVVVGLGDLVDRGPQSAQVLDYAISSEAPFRRIWLAGNHEQLMLRFLDSGSGASGWFE